MALNYGYGYQMSNLRIINFEYLMSTEYTMFAIDSGLIISGWKWDWIELND